MKGNILVSTDFSPASFAAFPYARAQAEAKKAKLEVLTVLASPAVPAVMFEYMPPPEEIDRIRHEFKKQAETKLKSLVQQHFAGLAPVQTVVQGLGSASDVILELAQQGAGMVVMSTHGHGFLGRIALGSVAERVLRHTPCPVLVVPTKSEEGKPNGAHLPCKRIVVTTDFSPAAEAGLAVAQEQAQMFGAKLTIAHVIEHPMPPELFDTQILAFAPEAEVLFQKYRAGFEEKLKKVAQGIKGAEASAMIVDKTYSVANSITEYAHNSQADLIVVATKGAGNRLNLIGGVAERIVRQSHCPVLIVPSKY